jgi:uncharacterized protein (DUF488 family)
MCGKLLFDVNVNLPRSVITIGAHEWSRDTFLAALQANEVRMRLDLRQRRGVRGREYAWANSQRLQAALAETGIEYRHHRELAPTTELRRLQYAEDARLGVGKRSRSRLAPEYASRYEREILDGVDLRAIAATFPREGNVALFCVEALPDACHRSLVAQRFADELGLHVVHVTPDRDVDKLR